MNKSEYQWLIENIHQLNGADDKDFEQFFNAFQNEELHVYAEFDVGHDTVHQFEFENSAYQIVDKELHYNITTI